MGLRRGSSMLRRRLYARRPSSIVRGRPKMEPTMSSEALKTQIARKFGTPADVIDLDRVEANITRVQQLCNAKGVANRPHIKTHKSPTLAKMQVAAGARGITCQKLGEAEVMVDGGLDDILISYNLLGEEKSRRASSCRPSGRSRAGSLHADTSSGITSLSESRHRRGTESCQTVRMRASQSAQSRRERRILTNRTKIPATLYKYRSFSNLTLDGLIADQLFFADPSTFNDPLDTKPVLEADLDAAALADILRRLVEERVRAE